MKKCKFLLCFALVVSLVTIAGCRRGLPVLDSNETEEETLCVDTLWGDTVLEDEVEDEGLRLEGRAVEAFGDFVFAFTHDKRFQAERIKFPLEVVGLDGTVSYIKRGSDFRNEFRLPGNDYYVLLLGNRSQMDVLLNDSSLSHVSLQCMDLEEESLLDYMFQRHEGRWHLIKREQKHPGNDVGDFLRFYQRFISDSLYQQSCLASHLSITMENPNDEESDVQGTIDASQWPVFRPEMPGNRFVSLNFGQQLSATGNMLLVQCGISNGMMDILTFRRDGEQWELVSYEN